MNSKKLHHPVLTALTMGVVSAAAPWAEAEPAPVAAGGPLHSFVVELKPGVGSPAAVAADLARRSNGQVGYVYRHALTGFSITIPEAALAGLSQDPRVALVEADIPMGLFEQTEPTGISRIFANPDQLAMDGVDDQRVDVDVAVLDTGIDRQHPDLNVEGGTNCLHSTGGSPWQRQYYCDTSDGDDDHYHGTHVAGTIGALDNGFGVVGVAPGARLWAVKVLDARGSGSLGGIIAGIDWVVARGNIEVINMSLGGSGSSDAMNTAIANAVDAGVSVVVAAGNDGADAANYTPANAPAAITVSALADFNGQAGGGAASTCLVDQDDTLAYFSNWGETVDIAAPGVCILSTAPMEQGEYKTLSGTSMATPHVAGAAALLASNRLAPDAVRSALLGSGNFDWSDDSGDGSQEPLLDISGVTPSFVATGGGGGNTNLVPSASFTFACTGPSCSFSDTSEDPDGGILSWAWSFGDNASSNAQNPSHTYAGGGTYLVTLTVTDGGGATAETSQSVSVSGSGGGVVADACDGLADGVHLTPSASSQGKTWTATVSALNCVGEDKAMFSPVNLSWAPDVGSKSDTCSNNDGSCQASQSGIRKSVTSVQFFLNDMSTTIIKP